MKISEALHFLLGLRDLTRTGTVMPTSRWGSQALLREFRRRRSPRRILEVGAGTGAVTSVLVRYMEPGDSLLLCEINPDYAAYLHHRFQTDPSLARVQDQVEFFEGSPGNLRLHPLLTTPEQPDPGPATAGPGELSAPPGPGRKPQLHRAHLAALAPPALHPGPPGPALARSPSGP